MIAAWWVAWLAGCGPAEPVEMSWDLPRLVVEPPVVEIELEDGEVGRFALEVGNEGELPMGLAPGRDIRGVPEGAWSVDLGEVVLAPGEVRAVDLTVVVPREDAEVVGLLELRTFEEPDATLPPRDQVWRDVTHPTLVVPLRARVPSHEPTALDLSATWIDLGEVGPGERGEGEVEVGNTGREPLEVEVVGSYADPGWEIVADPSGEVLESAPLRVAWSPSPAQAQARLGLALHSNDSGYRVDLVEAVVNAHLPYEPEGSEPDATDDDGDGFSELEGDCDDTEVYVNPIAPEICGDGLDNDCNGLRDTQEACISRCHHADFAKVVVEPRMVPSGQEVALRWWVRQPQPACDEIPGVEVIAPDSEEMLWLPSSGEAAWWRAPVVTESQWLHLFATGEDAHGNRFWDLVEVVVYPESEFDQTVVEQVPGAPACAAAPGSGTWLSLLLPILLRRRR